MIEVEQLTKYYGDNPAIEDVNFTVERGEIVGFLGPNGAGKTTTMRILTGFLPPTSGRASIAGFDVFENSLEARRHIGYMPETVPLYPEMTVREYLGFFASLRGVKKARQRIEEVAEQCSVDDVIDERTAKLSKGYRQRVGLAQALLHSPDVLILDEPTVGLDPRQITGVRQLIKDLAGQHTVILSTHILPEVSMVCQRVLIINEGRIVAEDTPEQLKSSLERAAQVHIQVARPSADLVPRLRAVPGVEAVVERAAGAYDVETALGSDKREELAGAVIQGGWGLLEMRQVGMSLEEIFLRLTTSDEPVPGETEDDDEAGSDEDDEQAER